MCGRFTQAYTWSEVHAFLGVFGPALNLKPRYNVAPTTEIGVVIDRGRGREIVPMRWGLVPYWWRKGLKELPATFNARAESLATKPMFRDSLRRRRCIIPASGFFEWTADQEGRQPHYFTARDGTLLAFAGLWDRWSDPSTGEELLSCAMIVSGASAWMLPYHDRMPVLLGEQDFEDWLSGTAGLEVLQPAAESSLREWLVSKRMNKTDVGDDDPRTIEPLGEAEPGSLFARVQVR